MKKKVMFNCLERKLCKKCGFPEGFCKHTIEEKLKKTCPDTPLNKEEIWQLVRSYAICKSERNNLLYHNNEDMEKLERKIRNLEEQNIELIKDNNELKAFKKHIEEVLRTINTLTK